MRKTASGKRGSGKQTGRRKLSDLAPMRVKAGEAGAVKGGPYNPPWSKQHQ